ncbi:T9SS type A sorting domain-containing protein [Chryseobacterium sp.]|uniref:T9SS type A sorting domain-containing protein n=1 Tax=Chryseobacterium sp. TaxID=1871047 RepID=UPI0025C33FF2|nr:T9SS type A sorting domain-containing protein [Chryseobacterium sp.]MBV8328782.1 T9SS type A sorting domain-containing protein [Chryseobacterium sp.]
MLYKKLLFVFAFIINAIMYAQLSEVNLGNPNNGSLSGNDQEKTIYYGTTPDNWNGKTIVFAHGFTATSSVFINGSLYKWAFNDGYRTVFVTTTKGGSMETNAELFAKGLDQIKTKLGSSKFYMLAHSNGGKSIDLALTVHGKKDMAIKVVTLGTPFKGTQIANIGEWPILNWVASSQFGDEGMKTSTTYYMENVRKTIDNHPNNDPSLFYHFGHTGYNQLSNVTFPNFLKYLVSGNTIKALGGGNNDGVTPYYSHYKLGGHIMVPEGEGKDNHTYLHEDFELWKKINQIFTENPASVPAKKENINSPVITEYSNYQLIYNEKPDLIVKDNTESYEVISIKERNAEVREAYMENYPKGKHSIKNNNGKFLTIYVSKENEGFLLEKDLDNNTLTIKDIQNHEIKNSFIKAEIYRLPENGNNNSGITQFINFKYNNSQNSYSAYLEGLSQGVYAMNIHMENNHYARDLISGFVIGQIELRPTSSELTSNIKNAKKGEALVIKNPATGNSFLRIDEKLNTSVEISIFDTSGKVVFKNTYKDFLNVADLPLLEKNRVYLVKVSYNAKDINLKYIP